VIENDVEVGRIFQGDPVKREVAGVIGDDEARNLLLPACARLFGQDPTRNNRTRAFFRHRGRQ
jgi:hypothetical protein